MPSIIQYENPLLRINSACEPPRSVRVFFITYSNTLDDNPHERTGKIAHAMNEIIAYLFRYLFIISSP